MDIRFGSKVDWNDDLKDPSSDAFKSIENAIHNWLNSFLGNILSKFGFRLEIEITIIPPVTSGSRRRRAGIDSPQIDVVVKMVSDSAPDNSDDVTQIGAQVTNEVSSSISSYSGNVIDKNIEPEISEVEVTGCTFDQAELDCNNELKVPKCVFPRDAYPLIAGNSQVR